MYFVNPFFGSLRINSVSFVDNFYEKISIIHYDVTGAAVLCFPAPLATTGQPAVTLIWDSLTNAKPDLASHNRDFVFALECAL